MPPGFEGLHIFDITNKTNPDLIASVDLQCGSHTQTMIPDLANNRLIVYVGSSSGTCQNFDIVEIPLANPAGARLLRQIPTEEHPCHDIGVILGSAMKLGCAGGNSLGIYSLGGPDGGSLDNPMMMHHILPGIPSSGHSAVVHVRRQGRHLRLGAGRRRAASLSSHGHAAQPADRRLRSPDRRHEVVLLLLGRDR